MASQEAAGGCSIYGVYVWLDFLVSCDGEEAVCQDMPRLHMDINVVKPDAAGRVGRAPHVFTHREQWEKRVVESGD